VLHVDGPELDRTLALDPTNELAGSMRASVAEELKA